MPLPGSSVNTEILLTQTKPIHNVYKFFDKPVYEARSKNIWLYYPTKMNATSAKSFIMKWRPASCAYLCICRLRQLSAITPRVRTCSAFVGFLFKRKIAERLELRYWIRFCSKIEVTQDETIQKIQESFGGMMPSQNSGQRVVQPLQACPRLSGEWCTLRQATSKLKPGAD